MLNGRTKKQIERLRKGDRDRLKTGTGLILLGVAFLVAAFWLRIKLEVSSAVFANEEYLWMVPFLLKDMVSGFFAIHVGMIAGGALCAVGLRELLDRNHRALLLALADDLERRGGAE